MLIEIHTPKPNVLNFYVFIFDNVAFYVPSGITSHARLNMLNMLGIKVLILSYKYPFIMSEIIILLRPFSI